MSVGEKTFVCVACPIGCPLQLVHEGGRIVEVEGHLCNRGAKYARQEFTDPRRVFSTTIPIAGALYARLPVKVSAPVPKDRLVEAARAVHRLRAEAPVRRGQVLAETLLGLEGVDVVATRTMRRVSRG